MDWIDNPPGDVQGEYISEYPNRVKDRGWWLLGTRETDAAVYLDSETEQIHLVQRDDEGQFITRKSRPLSEFNSRWQDIRGAHDSEFGWDTWSRYSWPTCVLDGFIGRSRAVVADEQMAAYVFREMFSIPREETAELLGKSPHTIDNQLSDARRGINHAKEFIEHLAMDRHSPVSIDPRVRPGD